MSKRSSTSEMNFSSRRFSTGRISSKSEIDRNCEKGISYFPKTPFSVVNRLASNIDESIFNLRFAKEKNLFEKEKTLNKLDEIIFQLRFHLEQRHRQCENQIRSSHIKYDQQIENIENQLVEIRKKLIENFSKFSPKSFDGNSFDFDLFSQLERFVHEIMRKQIEFPQFKIELHEIERLDEFFSVKLDEQKEFPICRTFSFDSSREKNRFNELNNSTENSGLYNVSFHHTLKTPLQKLEISSLPLKSGNYFVPLLTSYRENGLLIYCLDRQSFISYNCRSTKKSNSLIKWLGTRPSAIYWFDQINMLFIACCTHIYGCYLEEEIKQNERIPIRIPIEITSTWSDTQGQLVWPKFLTCGASIDELLYAYWTDKDQREINRNTMTSFICFQIERNNHKIKSRNCLDGRLRAINSSLLTHRLALLIEYPSDQCCHIEVRILRDFSILSKIELRTLFEEFHYGCSLTNLDFNPTSYLLTDHKQQQIWFVDTENGQIRVKRMKETIYSGTSLRDGTLALLLGDPMRFQFFYDPNDTGFLIETLFREEEESFEV